MSYQCPLCQLPLMPIERRWQCDNNHQFDIAKEGYINLMPAHHKNSKNPGDNAEMMQARRRFLESGHYAPLKTALVELLNTTLSSPSRLLDIGCGEGYYTQGLTALHTPETHVDIFGLDISKVAIRYAAKRYPDCQFSVASSHRLPFADDSLDAIVKIYAPCKAEELLRTLTASGQLVTVTPAARHLYELRALIYQDVRLHDPSDEVLPGFDLVATESLQYTMNLNSALATDLLQMTPFAWRATEQTWQHLASSTTFDCLADFCIRIYKPSA